MLWMLYDIRALTEKYIWKAYLLVVEIAYTRLSLHKSLLMDQKQQYIISATQLPRLYLLSLFCFIPSSESKNKFQKLIDQLRTLTD